MKAHDGLAAQIARDTFYSPLRYRDIKMKYGTDPDWSQMKHDLMNNRFNTGQETEEFFDSLISDTRVWFEQMKASEEAQR